MIKKVLFSAMMISLISCAQNSPKKLITKSGFEYTHVSTGGEQVKEGDYVYIAFSMKGSDGTVLQEIEEGPNMPIMQMPKPDQETPMKNPVVDMLMNGGLGDSMTLIIPLDSLPNKDNPQFAGMEYLEYETYISRIEDETGYKADMEARRLEQEKKMEESKARLEEVGENVNTTLADYKDGKLDVQTTPEGLKYVIHEQGEGPFGETTKRVSVHYYGVLMDGKMFDSSFKRGMPLPFTVGRGEVIRGWDLGIPLLRKGGKASLFIPSELAYGASGNPPVIPENADLMFYVELMDVN
ncbi:MAG: FKBP-type peptidyl-prolyl cis-trans isomerase [Bacteroidota bacterium]